MHTEADSSLSVVTFPAYRIGKVSCTGLIFGIGSANFPSLDIAMINIILIRFHTSSYNNML